MFYLYMHIYGCVVKEICTRMHICVEVRGRHWISSLIMPHDFFLRQGLSLNLALTDSTSLVVHYPVI